MPVRLNHVWNITCFAFFFCVMTGLLFWAAVLVGEPAVACFVMIGTGLWMLLLMYRNTRLADRHLRLYADSHEYSPNLRQIVDGLCAAAGKKPSEVPLYDFDLNRTAQLSRREKSKLASYILRAQTHNAAARSDMLLVSTPLLKLLDDGEEKAIFAHELAHVVFRHGFYFTIMATMTTMVFVLAAAYFWLTVFSFGWHVLALPAAAMLVSAYIGKNFFPGLLYQTGFLNFVTVYGLLYMVSPVFLKVAVIVILLRRLPKICYALYSQACEYMADKAAVDLGANPLHLAMALRKITFLQKRAQQKFSPRRIDASTDGLIDAYFQLYATHPPIDRRVERLCHIASFTLGIPWAEMQKTRYGAIDLPADHDIPDEVVKSYMSI